jgi:hypothetical protein
MDDIQQFRQSFLKFAKDDITPSHLDPDEARYQFELSDNDEVRIYVETNKELVCLTLARMMGKCTGFIEGWRAARRSFYDLQR